MRHKSNRLRLNQKPNHARLLERNLVTSLVLYESIRTTRKRARVIQPLIDHLITVSKTKTAQIAIRSINQTVLDVNASKKLMEVLSKRYTARSSGFTRLKAVGARKGDGADLVDLTLVDAELASKAAEKTKKIQKTKKAVESPKSSPSAESPESSTIS